MKSLFNKSFSILKENMLFIQPILLYLFFLSITIQYALNPGIFLYSKIILTICIILLSFATIGGVYYISKKAVDTYHQNDNDEIKQNNSIQNFKLFFEGVGKTFFKVFLASILFCVIYLLVLWTFKVICNHLWGAPAFITRSNEFLKIENMAQVQSFISSLSSSEIKTMRMWIFALLPLITILNYIGYLYFAVVISEKSNFFICFFKSVIFSLKNIFKSLSIILFMFFIYIAINMISSIFGSNPILMAIAIVLMVMYINYYVILVLCFYNEKSESNSDSRPECFGENESCN